MVLSSPSGGGKTTIARRLLAARSDLAYSISATTRAKRADEEDGVAYHFLTRSEFERRVAAGEFLEWAEYGTNWYGTLRAEVERGLNAGRHVVLDIDVQGADSLRRGYANAIHLFVLPPSGEELVRRLEARGTEDPASMARRLAIASGELGAVSRYDFVVVNDDLDHAVRQVSEIIDVEAARPSRLPRLEGAIAAMRRALARP